MKDQVSSLKILENSLCFLVLYDGTSSSPGMTKVSTSQVPLNQDSFEATDCQASSSLTYNAPHS